MADGGVVPWLASTALSELMRSNLWLYPIVEIVHIVGITVLVGGVALFDLRLLGFGRALPVDQLARHLLPWSLASLGLVVPAGLLLFSADPTALAGNRMFLLKLTLIAAAGLNALLFHLGVFRSVSKWNAGQAVPGLARMHAVISLALWVAVITCGRLLAYV